MTKPNYRIVNTCMNCQFCVTDSPQDYGTYYYCNFDHSFKSAYRFDFTDFKTPFEEKLNWRGEHRVQENTICDNFVLKEIEG